MSRRQSRRANHLREWNTQMAARNTPRCSVCPDPGPHQTPDSIRFCQEHYTNWLDQNRDDHVEVWVIPTERTVLVTDLPGPPAAILGYVSPEAQAAHQARGPESLPTVSEIGFPKECWLGHFKRWDDAEQVAQAKVVELGGGYKIKRQSRQWGCDEDELDDEWPDEDDFDENDSDFYDDDLED